MGGLGRGADAEVWQRRNQESYQERTHLKDEGPHLIFTIVLGRGLHLHLYTCILYHHNNQPILQEPSIW